MGDMKTPDFDDLLAAFDIPDIDAKEAIQSSPEEEGHGGHNGGDGTREMGGPSCFPCSPLPQGDHPAVSVIVRNSVRHESYGEGDNSVSEDANNSTDDAESFSNSGVVPKDEAEITCKETFEPQMHDRFQFSVPRVEGQTNGELWPRRSPLSSSPTSSEQGAKEVADAGSASHTADVMSTLRPLLYPQSSASATPPVPFTPSLSSPPSCHSVSQQPPPSPQPIQKEETSSPYSPPSSPPALNGSMRGEVRHISESEEEDSEPDLGSPLVIQESPESLMSPSSSIPQGCEVSTELLGSLQTSPSCLLGAPPLSSSPAFFKPKPRPNEEVPSTPSSTPTAPELKVPQSCPSSSLTQCTSAKEEKYPEHVIEERDSPESPPPDQTGFAMPRKSLSPAPASAPAFTSNHKDPIDQAEPMENEPSQQCVLGEVSEAGGEKMEVGDGGKADKENSGTGSPSVDATCDSAAEAGLPLSRLLKVKIKMVKTPTGSITGTVTGVPPKNAGGVPSETVDGSKLPPGNHNIVSRPKRDASQKRTPNSTETLPPGPRLQDASAAMLTAASKLKNKTAIDAKLQVSPTAVSITKAAALPSISSSRISTEGVGMCGPGQKTLISGVTVTSLTPPLPPHGSRLASIVNNTGSIISKSQSNLVEAFNKILNSKNLLPSYKPDLSSPLPAEWGLPLPAQGYRCLECGDAFALERSLARHYDRRSLRIEVTCNHCAKRLVFFNKCSLLLHAREHKEKGLIMQCSHLVMKPVSVEQMVGQQEPTPVAVLSPSLLSSAGAPSSSALNTAVANPAPQLQQATTGKKAEPVQYKNNTCPECLVQFCSKEEVAAHFQEVKPAQSTCTECSPPMLLPNSCSSAAHQRIHKACPPHVCPECGGISKQPGFQTHLDEACLHFARRIGYRCSSCQVVFGGLNSVKSHIQVAHCDTFHKCPSCPMAFKSAASTQNHITTQHPTLTGGQAKMIYKCVMCDTVFTQNSQLYVHFDIHLANQKVHVFKCPECTKLFSQRNSLMDHMKCAHKAPLSKQDLPSPAPPATSSRSQSSTKPESSDGEDQEGEEKGKVNGERTATTSGWKCASCRTHYTDREAFVTHMAEQHGKIMKKFPCNKCESSFTTTSSLRRHIRVKHKGIKRGYHCQFCTDSDKTFNSRVMLERHIQLRHSMEAASQDAPQAGSGLDEVDSSSEHDSGPGSQQKRKGAVKAARDGNFSDRVRPAKKTRLSSSAPAPSSLPESGFRCAPCGFTTEDQAAFLEHIPQHRTEGTAGRGVQCLQCGACFTSLSSLSRHRFITHKVRVAPADGKLSLTSQPAPSPGGSENYDDTNPRGGFPPVLLSSRPSAPHDKEGEGRLDCKVCGKHFEKTTDLNTHFRTHGMAFINTRNSGKAT
ncbi:zinc finger protein 687a isoform X2 [Lampris incognitus]|uniref:zinc finger protein 687a isoform X2 n=1 Tax=Lampris incognitus TaxID=2546036 RepID=UPI0024B5B5AA|nr:zinc finger protein 687a isoform X2 [Lampris incognitus]